jgi:predicted flap endonuclease-1-like 5' DNA nuclease
LALFLALVVAIAAFGVGCVVGRRRGMSAPTASPPSLPPSLPSALAVPAATPSSPMADDFTVERARIIRSYEAEASRLRRGLRQTDQASAEVAALHAETAHLAADAAAARAEAARYRQLVVDIENNAPPPLFGPGAPDDLKLIVGIGPVLERMLHVLGVTTYRQIARWTERDIDDIDAKLPEFPGRIRRDGWVTQARALHQSKYGETLPARGQ